MTKNVIGMSEKRETLLLAIPLPTLPHQGSIIAVCLRVQMLRGIAMHQMGMRPWEKEEDLPTMSPTEVPNVALARIVIGMIEAEDLLKRRPMIDLVSLTDAE